jgi:hypothetical protein
MEKRRLPLQPGLFEEGFAGKKDIEGEKEECTVS